MKHIIFVAGLALGLSYPALAEEAKPETKKVCMMEKDAKSGKEKEVCKNVKVHKKHEGTAVPDKAPPKKDEKKDKK